MKYISKFTNFSFKHHKAFMLFFTIISAVLLLQIFKLNFEQDYDKQLPHNHPIIQNYLDHRDDFGNANKILIAIEAKNGTIFTKAFMNTLKNLTEEVNYLPYVDRTKVKSIFTPDSRFIEIVEDGFQGGNLIPHDFKPNDAFFKQVRNNIDKSSYLGFLVSRNYDSALISADLLTVEKPDYILLSKKLDYLRDQYQTKDISVHIIGFPKIIGDLAEGTYDIIFFFFAAVLLTTSLLYFFVRSLKLTLSLVICSILAIIWQFGLLSLFSFSLNIYSILLPFLIFAIAISHGVQILKTYKYRMTLIRSSRLAAYRSQEHNIRPGLVALFTDGIGFFSIYLIPIPVLQELAIAATIGIACIILTNIFILPLVLSFLTAEKKMLSSRKVKFLSNLFIIFDKNKRHSLIALFATLLLIGFVMSSQVPIGDQDEGIPEFYPKSRYNLDTKYINNHYDIGIDVLKLYIHAKPDSCIHYETLREIEDLNWHIKQDPYTHATQVLTSRMKDVNQAWNEGYPKWHTLSRNQYILVQSVRPFDTSTGLLNEDCSIMPLSIFTNDHKYLTIKSIMASVEDYLSQNKTKYIEVKTGGGNLSLLGATNEVIENSQFLILSSIYIILFITCMIYFRSFYATISILLPLALISLLTNALMNFLNIGLKVSTLPVAALGIGIGVDYGIYFFSHIKRYLKEQASYRLAFKKSIETTGKSILFTGITLSLSTMIWIFSPLKFQADMGILLSFMFFGNMIAAMIFIPLFYGVLTKRF